MFGVSRRKAAAAAGQGVSQARISQHRGHRTPQSIAVHGVKVGIARNDIILRRSAEITVQRMRPQQQLVPIAQTIAILWPVKHRRRRGECHDGDGTIRRLHWHDPMPRRGQPLNVCDFIGPQRTVRQRRPRQIAPQQR